MAKSTTTLLVLACAFVARSSAIPVSPTKGIASAPVDDKVKVALYYESLCPSCRKFVGNELSQAVKELSSIMRLSLHPFGNAK
jgi:hypothetical protein